MRFTFIRLSFLLTWPILIYGQALPDLPAFPSPSPAPTPSPLPSALAELIAASPSPVKPTAVPAVDNPQNAVPFNSPAVASINATPTPATGTNPTETNTASIDNASGDGSTVSSQPSPIPSPSPTISFVNELGVCERSKMHPQPKLGKSQTRYAVSVLLSAGAVAAASVFYGIALDWEPENYHIIFRLLMIICARLLVIGAIRVSAALVASITKSSPDDSALDASGAFLTWGSAIFTRVYFEGFKMTMAALDFIQNDSVWDDKLKEFLSINRTYEKVKDSEGLDDEQQVSEYQHESYLQATSPKNPGLIRRIFGGSVERRLVLLTAVLYLASEISTLSANVISLLSPFLEPESINYFTDDTQPGQCGIRPEDKALLGGLIATQIIYALTEQPSLVPLLIVSSTHPNRRDQKSKKRFSKKYIYQNMRWLSTFVVMLWIASLLVLPVFSKPFEPFFTAGDVTLFWFVIIAPPTYTSVSYIITATFTCFSALVAIFILCGISKHEQKIRSMDPIL